MVRMRNLVNMGKLIAVFFPVLAFAQEPKIDVHVHTYHNAGDVHWHGPGLPANATHEQKNEDKFRRTQKLWDKYNVKVGVTSGELERIVGWQKADPERVLPGMIMGPAPIVDKEFLDRIRAMAKKGEVQVLGEIALQYDGIAPDNPVYDVYFSLAEELDLPIAIHLGLGFLNVHQGAPRYRVRAGDPLLLEEALNKHPNMRIYVMHAGWPFLDNMIGIMHTYPQVYVGLGNINHNIPKAEFHHYLKRLVDAGFGKRIMFGSDAFAPDRNHTSDPFYYISFEERYARSIEYIESADFLSKEQKRDIFYNNAARFLRLNK